MKDNSFTATIEVPQTPEVVINCVKDVSKWWGGKDLEGTIDEFTITHGDAHYSRQKLLEYIPDKKIVWLITESNLNWIEKDKYEWTNTKLVFEITTKRDKTLLHFTHEGLTPDKECYSRCANEGWDIVIKDYLFKFITEGKAHF